MSQFIELNRAIQILSDEHDAEYPTENDRYMATREALIQAAQATPVEPVALSAIAEWDTAPTMTKYGAGMVQALIAISKDETLILTCHRDALRLPSPLHTAPPASVEPVAYRFKNNRGNGKFDYAYYEADQVATAYYDNCLEITPLYTTPPADPTPEMCIAGMNAPRITGLHHASGYFHWSWPSVGVGELSYRTKSDGEIEFSAENMGANKIRNLLHAFADVLADEYADQIGSAK